ncbi:MAG: hypothetical protein FJ398_21215 [Verrucomicrobia bacterium]|nr:hypothetical protein [Verrucomicrobiota bacterium]
MKPPQFFQERGCVRSTSRSTPTVRTGCGWVFDPSRAPFGLRQRRATLYPQFAVGSVAASPLALELVRSLRNAIPRYGVPAICATVIACACLLPRLGEAQAYQGPQPLAAYDFELTNYSRLEPTTAVAHLQRRIERGEVKLARDEQFGYLMSLLKELNVSPASQLLVFSKTSLQRPHISPKHPRAIFFNDAVCVAWIPGAPMIEILSVDPKLGAVFYTLDQAERPATRMQRDNRCLECHVSPRTLDVPGPLIRSFQTSSEGEVDLLSGSPQINHATPLHERWGGWFVTGDYGGLVHRGNKFSPAERIQREPESNATPDLNALGRSGDLSLYPRPSSDIVALMIFEHQIQMQNLLTRLNYESEAALRQSGHVRSLNHLSEAFLNYLMFADEVPIPGRIEGDREFASWFEAQGPRDKQGRSLRQLDLKTRLFKFPCSYMIYSDAFERLPYPMRQHLYHRLWAILTGEDRSAEYQKLPAETKRAIFEILAETKPNLPAYWNL